MFDIKTSRGLAVSAVSALAITGLTFIPSQAVAAPGEDVVMLSQLGGKASVRPDGDDDQTQYVDLVAEQREPEAITSFQVNANPAAGDTATGWTAIEGESRRAGSFTSVAWNAVEYVGDTVSLRAVATTGSTVTYSTVTGVAVTGSPEAGGTAPHSISVKGQNQGYFTQPYATSGHTATQIIIDGTTSAVDGTVDLSWWRSSDGTFRGSTAAALTLGEGKITDGDGDDDLYYDIGEFNEPFDITGYDAEANDDVLTIRGVRDSDDVTSIETYSQTIGHTWASVQDDTRLLAQVEVQVEDEQGAAVPGAEVRRLRDQKLIGYTDGDGDVVAEQDAGTTESYYANTTDIDGYEVGIDFVTEEVILQGFTPVSRGAEPLLADGSYFDDDEYEAGDISLQLVDQEGDPFIGAVQDVRYWLYRKGAPIPGTTTTDSDADGRVVVPFDPSAADGTYVLDYSQYGFSDDEPREAVEFTSGDSSLTLTPSGSATSGGQITYTGNLSLGAVPLPGRSIDLTYARGTEPAPGTADAGIVVGDARVLATTVTTDEDGQFTVTVADPVKANRPAETGGTLTATATAAKETTSASVTFSAAPVAPAPPSVKAPVKAKLKLSGSSKGGAADKLKVTSTKKAAGQRVRIFAKAGKGRWKVVATVRLNRLGRVSLKVKDRNGKKLTSYRVQSTATPVVTSSRSNVKRLR